MKHNFRAFVGQLFGQMNTFGYSKKIINQAMMVYWFLGDFYTSKIFNRCITRFWITFNVLAVILLFTHSFCYMVFSSNIDLSKLLFASQVVISIAYIHICTPVSSQLYRKGIVQTFKILDRINLYELQTDLTESRKKSYFNVAYIVFCAQITFFSLYMICTYLNLIFEYSTEKLSDPNYFIYPLYSENVDQLSTFIALQISEMISSLPVGPMHVMIPFFPIILANEFYNKFQALSNALKYQNEAFKRHFEKRFEQSEANHEDLLKMEESFVKEVQSFARYHHNLLRGISGLRSYLEFNMSINLFSFLYVEILLIYIITQIDEESILHKMRVTANACIFGTMQLVYCFVGKLFSDMGDMFTEAVYDTPWYHLSPPNRKSVHLLLNQAKFVSQFKALKIYPLNMGFFLKSCNNVYSIVNLLRRTTKN